MIAAAHTATQGTWCDITEGPTTDGMIALLNLEAQIEGLKANVGVEHWSVEDRVGLVDLITLRGLILGRIADYEQAEEIAEQLVRDAPADGMSFLARARTRAVFHRFSEALDDLAAAERLSLDAKTADGERAAIFQALGRYDEALVIREEANDRQANFENIAALAGLCAERGEVEAAQDLHAESRSHYRGVSPFPLALLDFELGLMWMRHGQLDDARTLLDAALRRVPAFAPAQGHLAEVEVELGDIETAIDRLHPLASFSDDPDYAAHLARILEHVGRADESRYWCRLAAARYEELIADHPEAFADHAAEFWLAAGADPNKALRLARLNFEVRKTPRAYDLLSQAIGANQAAKATVSSILLEADAATKAMGQ